MVNSLRFAYNRTSIASDRRSPFFEPTRPGHQGLQLHPAARWCWRSPAGSPSRRARGQRRLRHQRVSAQRRPDARAGPPPDVGRRQHGVLDATTRWRTRGPAATGRSTARPTGLGLADFLMGRVAILEHGGPANSPIEQWYIGLYAQDTWRATDRVTFNLGLRWEPFFGAERRERRDLQLQHREVPQGRARARCS